MPRRRKYPGFLHANYIITWAWTGATLLMMIGNIALIYVPGLPLWSGLLIAFAARNSAVYFTKWYPEYRKAKYGNAAGQRPAGNALNGIQPRSASNREQDDERRIRQLGTDFLSTILFLVIYLATDNVLLATGVAIAGAIAQVIYSRVKGQAARLHDLGEPRAGDRARQRDAADPRSALRAGQTRDRAFCDRR